MLFYTYFHTCKGNPSFICKSWKQKKNQKILKKQSEQFEKSRFRDSNSPSSGLTNSCSNLVSRSTYRCTKWGTLSTDDFCRILIFNFCLSVFTVTMKQCLLTLLFEILISLHCSTVIIFCHRMLLLSILDWFLCSVRVWTIQHTYQCDRTFQGNRDLLTVLLPLLFLLYVFGNFSIPLYMLFYTYFHTCKGILTCNPSFICKSWKQKKNQKILKKTKWTIWEK